jgi:hypothetical protein
LPWASLLVSLSGRQFYWDARVARVHDTIRALNNLYLADPSLDHPGAVPRDRLLPVRWPPVYATAAWPFRMMRVVAGTGTRTVAWWNQ